MKHLLNNMTEEEKNSIREQHVGGMKVMTENFSKLTNSKSGDIKSFLNEQPSNPQPSSDSTYTFPIDVMVSENKILFPKKLKIAKGTVAKLVGNNKVMIDSKPTPLYYIPSENELISDSYTLSLYDNYKNSYLLQWADSIFGKVYNQQYQKIANDFWSVFDGK